MQNQKKIAPVLKRNSKVWETPAAYLLLCLSLNLIQACSSPSKKRNISDKVEDQKTLLTQLCSQGQSIAHSSGSVWFKVKSEELNGQFPANIQVDAKGDLQIEITDLVGGPVADVRMDSRGKNLTLSRAGKPKKVFSQEWNGIPLWWIHALVLGRFPCPSLTQVKTQWVDDETLEAKVPGWSYRYKMTLFKGRPWASKLEAQKLETQKNDSSAIEFVFENPDENFGVPLKWEAVSSLGELKIRWRDRENKVTSH